MVPGGSEKQKSVTPNHRLRCILAPRSVNQTMSYVLAIIIAAVRRVTTRAPHRNRLIILLKKYKVIGQEARGKRFAEMIGGVSN